VAKDLSNMLYLQFWARGADNVAVTADIGVVSEDINGNGTYQTEDNNPHDGKLGPDEDVGLGPPDNYGAGNGYLDEEDMDGDTTAVLELTPRSESTAAQLTQIHLWVSEESWLPVQQKFFQPGGDYFVARYTAVKVNRQLPHSTFEISAAKGAKRVKMN
jgi:hypothetical protein